MTLSTEGFVLDKRQRKLEQQRPMRRSDEQRRVQKRDLRNDSARVPKTPSGFRRGPGEQLWTVVPSCFN